MSLVDMFLCVSMIVFGACMEATDVFEGCRSKQEYSTFFSKGKKIKCEVIEADR